MRDTFQNKYLSSFYPPNNIHIIISHSIFSYLPSFSHHIKSRNSSLITKHREKYEITVVCKNALSNLFQARITWSLYAVIFLKTT